MVLLVRSLVSAELIDESAEDNASWSVEAIVPEADLGLQFLLQHLQRGEIAAPRQPRWST